MTGEGTVVLNCRSKHTHIIPMKAGKAGRRPKMFKLGLKLLKVVFHGGAPEILRGLGTETCHVPIIQGSEPF